MKDMRDEIDSFLKKNIINAIDFLACQKVIFKELSYTCCERIQEEQLCLLRIGRAHKHGQGGPKQFVMNSLLKIEF
jgi:hypothetical protein